MHNSNSVAVTAAFRCSPAESAQIAASISTFLSIVGEKFRLQIVQKTTAKIRRVPDTVVGTREQTPLAGAVRGSI
jgi:hypothetical protein